MAKGQKVKNIDLSFQAPNSQRVFVEIKAGKGKVTFVEEYLKTLESISALASDHLVFVIKRRTRHGRPPSSAILSALLPGRMSEDVIANLNELFYEVWVPRHGERTARRIWLAQATSMIVRHWLAPFKSIADTARRMAAGG
jgi:hypothetical protein